MNIEQEHADFESWLYLDQTKYDPERMSKQEIEIAKLAYQAGRAALQSQEYTAAIGEAGQAYMDSFKYAHPLPVQFRWSELWAVMCVAANKGRTDATQSQDREGWKEAAIAWEVCASLHRDYAKGRDPLFKTRQSDFVKHAEDSRLKALSPCSTEDKTDAERYRWLRNSAGFLALPYIDHGGGQSFQAVASLTLPSTTPDALREMRNEHQNYRR